MKKIFIIFITVFLTFSLFPKQMYIIARICPVLQDSASDSKRVSIAKQGELFEITDIKDGFYKTNNGWIRSIFLSDKMPSIVKDVGSDLASVSSLEVRKRASYYSSSAAATRGLSSESVRDRENVKFRDYDFESVKWLEKNFKFTDEQILSFSEENFVLR